MGTSASPTMKDWSTTAVSNDTAGDVNWAENQNPNTVNNSARQVMADARNFYETMEWRDWGHTPTRTGNTTFTVPTDVTSVYTVGRRIKCTDSSTLYGTVVVSSVFSSVTTVTVVLDSGNLSASLTAVAVGMDPTNNPIPASAVASQANPNLLINGGFDIWQRGTTFTSTTPSSGANDDDSYFTDMWIFQSDTNDVADLSRNSSTTPDNAVYSCAFNTETPNKKFGIAQVLDSADTKPLVGQPLTLSFQAMKDATAVTLSTLRAAVIQWAGTADSITSDLVADGAWGAAGADPTLATSWSYLSTPTDLTLTTSFQTFTITTDAVLTTSAENIGVFIWVDDTDCTVSDLLYIGAVKLEVGSTATSFVKAGARIQDELSMCQRYYWRISADATALFAQFANGFNRSTTQALVNIQMPQTMRVAPTLETSGTAADYEILHTATNTACSVVPAISANATTQDVAGITATVASGLTTYNPAILRAANTANAYLGFSAEL